MVVSPKNIPMLVVGDLEGYVTVAVIGQQATVVKAFNAHEDKSAKGVELMMEVDKN